LAGFGALSSLNSFTQTVSDQHSYPFFGARPHWDAGNRSDNPNQQACWLDRRGFF